MENIILKDLFIERKTENSENGKFVEAIVEITKTERAFLTYDKDGNLLSYEPQDNEEFKSLKEIKIISEEELEADI